MVIDKLENLEKYYVLNPLFKEVAAFLAENDMNALPTGIHKIKGDDLFVNIQEAKGKTRDEAVVEYHRKLIDIQIPFSGTETYGYIPVSELPKRQRLLLPRIDYDPAISFVLDDDQVDTYVLADSDGQGNISFPF